MPTFLARNLSKARLLSKTGDISQIAGLRRIEIAEGPGKGVGAVEVTTGGGLVYTVLLDRGMDITHASYDAVNLAWRSPSGDCHPARYDDKGPGWLRTFPGGMLTTCGLLQTGALCRDGDEELGVHGRYTSLSASNVSQRTYWKGNDYHLELSGEMREAVIFGENMLLRREILTKLGDPGFLLRDTVVNEGPRTVPHMILYHCNYGFPLLDAATYLETPNTRIEPRDEEAAKGESEACHFGPPQANYREKVYFHHLKADRKGSVTIRLTNPDLRLSVSMTYLLNQLPYFTQWKMLGNREYVCGLEPGNALVMGRAEERHAGRLSHLKPGETRTYKIRFQVQREP